MHTTAPVCAVRSALLWWGALILIDAFETTNICTLICTLAVLLVMVLSQHQNFHLWYLVDKKKNKDFHPLAHLSAKICLNPSNADRSMAFEWNKGCDQWVQLNPPMNMKHLCR